ncbi:DNA translocase FtsK [uncultured Helicobacter sp.]|uniref:DNA translocase FtsK n=1 Tax=uncultured Helicobacter sp. TaxID=175537 RepID=UPI00374F9433
MLVILQKGFPIKKPEKHAKKFNSRIYLYIFSNILLLFLSIATIVGESGMVGVLGQQFAILNLSIFGYLGYVYLLFLLYPAYYLYKNPTLDFRKLELAIAGSLGFVSLLLAQSLLLRSGLFGNSVVHFLQNFIGVFGVWILVIGCLLLSILVATQSNIDIIFKQLQTLIIRTKPFYKAFVAKLLALYRVILRYTKTLYALLQTLGKTLVTKLYDLYHTYKTKLQQYKETLRKKEQERIEHIQAIHTLNIDAQMPQDPLHHDPNPPHTAEQVSIQPQESQPTHTQSMQTSYTQPQDIPTYHDPIPDDLQIQVVQNSALDSESFLQERIQEYKDRFQVQNSMPQTPQQPQTAQTPLIQEITLSQQQEITQNALNNAYKTAYYGSKITPKTTSHTQPITQAPLDIQAIIHNSHQADFTQAPKKQPHNPPKPTQTPLSQIPQQAPHSQPTQPTQSTHSSTQDIISSLDIQELQPMELQPAPTPATPATPLSSHTYDNITESSALDSIMPDIHLEHTPELSPEQSTQLATQESPIAQPNTLQSTYTESYGDSQTPEIDTPKDTYTTLMAPPQPNPEQSPTPKPPKVHIVRELDENTALLRDLDFGKSTAPLNFKLPPTSLLNQPDTYKNEIDEVEIDTKSEILLAKLKTFKIDGDVVRTYTGPIVTTFEFRPAPNVKVSRILNLEDDIALALSAKSIRIQAPVPGKDVVGIEIPNNKTETIFLREILESDLFKKTQSPLTLAFGKDIVGNPFVQDLRKLPHLLIAGTTGSGKSVGINAMILSLLYKNSPDTLKLMMIDPKRVEFSLYSDIPHLITPIITDPKKAIVGLNNAMHEMDRRYEKMKDMRVKEIESYNKKAREEGEEEMQYFVIIIDELADLMQTSGREAEAPLSRIAQMGRACGMHLIIATQRPSVDVVTGTLKGNLPSRISYKVGSKVDSKVILDDVGAASLLGRGDMLFKISDTIIRLHAPFSTEEEIESVVSFIKSQREPNYDKSFLLDDKESILAGGDFKDDGDDMLEQIKRFMLESGNTSSSSVQRRFSIGFNRATNYVEQLEKEGFLSKRNAKGIREIIR